MKKGAGLGGITEEIFKKRQEMMGKIVEQILVELFSDELNRETMVFPNCGRMLNDEVQNEIDSLLHYLKENKDRMNYKQVKKGGYRRISDGSGVIESSNKTVCHTRFEAVRSVVVRGKGKPNARFEMR